jgi:hypothetical protein
MMAQRSPTEPVTRRYRIKRKQARRPDGPPRTPRLLACRYLLVAVTCPLTEEASAAGSSAGSGASGSVASLASAVALA